MKINNTGVLNKAIVNSIYGLSSRIIAMLASFAVRTVLIYRFGTEYVGLNSLFSSILTIFNLSELGIGSAIVFHMYGLVEKSENDEICRLLALYKRIYLFIGGAILTIGMCLLPFLHFIISSDVPADINIYVLYLIFLTNTTSDYFLFSYRTSVFSAHQRNELISKIEILTNIGVYIFQIIVLLTTHNYYYYVLVLLLSVIPKNILILFFFRKEFPDLKPTNLPEKEVVKSIFSKVTPLLGHKIGASFLVSIDSIVISSFLGLIVLGQYNNYYYIISTILGFTSVIQQSVIAGIGQKLVTSDHSESLKMYRLCSFVWQWIVSCCSICFLCLFQNFMQLWVGIENMMPTYTMVILVMYYYAWQFRVMGLVFKDAAGLWKQDWLKPYIGMILNFVSSIILVKVTNNVIGVLIPTIFIFLFIYFPWETNVICKNIFCCKIHKAILPSLVHAIYTIFLAAISIFLCYSVPGNNFITLIIRAIIAMLIPNATFILLYHKSKEYLAIKAKVISIIKRSERKI